MKTPVVVLASGVWDLCHRGHLNLLWRASQLGEVLVVGVVSDAGARAYKGLAPVQNIRVRMEAMRRLWFVDLVERQAGTDPSALLERFLPDVFVHGEERGWERLLEGHDTLVRLGVQYVTLPYTPGISTTALRAARNGAHTLGVGTV